MPTYVNDDLQEVRLVDETGAEEGGVDQAERRRKALAAQQHRVAQAREAREHQRVSARRPDCGLDLDSSAAGFVRNLVRKHILRWCKLVVWLC